MIPKTFKYWFTITQDPDVYRIWDKAGEVLGEIDVDKDKVDMWRDYDLESSVLADFNRFVKRPEFRVGRQILLDGVPTDIAIKTYEELITGVIKIRALQAGKEPDEQQDYVDRVLNWIRDTSFYDDPASTIYHEAFKHGLLYHTLRVYNKMVELRYIPTFDKADVASATLVCLCHDWCKIGLYESYKRNVKNEQTGQWEKVDSYRRGKFPHALGHGVSSAYIATKLFRLSEEEFAAIRWHMGRYNVSENEVNEFQQCNETMPLVHLVQFADQLAITEY